MENEAKILKMLVDIEAGIKQPAATSSDLKLEVLELIEASRVELDRRITSLQDYRDVTQEAALEAMATLNAKEDVSEGFLRTEYENLIRQCLRGHPAISYF